MVVFILTGLPSKDTILTDQSISGEGNSQNQHNSLIRGSSLPNNNDHVQQLLNCTQSGIKNNTFESNIDQTKMVLLKVEESNIASEKVEQSTITPSKLEKSITAPLKVKESIEVLPKDEESNTVLLKVDKLITISPKVKDSINDQSTNSITALRKVNEPYVSSSKEEESNILLLKFEELNIVSPKVKDPIVAKLTVKNPNTIPQNVKEALVDTPNTEVSIVDPSINQNSNELPKFKNSNVIPPNVEKPIYQESTVSSTKVDKANTIPLMIEDSKVVPRSVENKNGKNTICDNVRKEIIKHDKMTVMAEPVESKKDEKPLLVAAVEKFTEEEKIQDEMVSGVQELNETTDINAEAEFRLTMIQSVREAVNKICEQAVERTAAIVSSGHGRPNVETMVYSDIRDKRDADDSEAADYASSEFSLPPPPIPSLDIVSFNLYKNLNKNTSPSEYTIFNLIFINSKSWVQNQIFKKSYILKMYFCSHIFLYF